MEVVELYAPEQDKHMEKGFSHTRAKRVLDMFRATSTAAHELGVGRQLIEDESFAGDTIIIQGAKVANFGLCSYLGLGNDERLIEGAIDATRRFGTSYSSSIAYTALGMYGELSERLEEMMGAPVILAATTTLAHLAALPVLISGGDTVYVDGQAHASLLAVIPTLASNGATVEMVRHNDIEELDRRLSESDRGGASWFITDGIFSMHGDTVPVDQVHHLLKKHPRFHVYCDDAHGFGWSGKLGCGTYLGRTGWHERLVISVGLAKSFGTMGGVVATPNVDFIDMINLTGSPLVFGGPIPPPILGASIASADIHLSDELPALQGELDRRIKFVNAFSDSIGLPLAGFDETPLWFLEVGASKKVLEGLSMMKTAGFFVNGAVFPVVPRNHGGLRFTVTNYNSLSQIEAMLVELNRVWLALSAETAIEIDLTDDLVTDTGYHDDSGASFQP
ncbi:aminotransferase class I/II-fold pyridoxal phosphate-dependent enzyme [soil metagenome]